jgi:hypothetical protein
MTQQEINDLREPRNAKNCVMSGIAYLVVILAISITYETETCQTRYKASKGCPLFVKLPPPKKSVTRRF